MSDKKGLVQRQVTNLNELRDTAFELKIVDMDHVNFFTVAANLPGLQLGDVTQITPLGRVAWSGDHQFEELQVQFIVDEDMNNWIEIYEWMRKISTISDYEEYDIKEVHKDSTLIIKTNQLNANIAIMFRDLVPRSISGIDFDSRKDTPDIVTATVTFGYTDYVLERV